MFGSYMYIVWLSGLHRRPLQSWPQIKHCSMDIMARHYSLYKTGLILLSSTIFFPPLDLISHVRQPSTDCCVSRIAFPKQVESRERKQLTKLHSSFQQNPINYHYLYILAKSTATTKRIASEPCSITPSASSTNLSPS